MTRDEMVMWGIVLVVAIVAIYYFKLVPRGAPWWMPSAGPFYDAQTGSAEDVHGVPYTWNNPSR